MLTMLTLLFLSNSSPKSKVQTSVLGLGVDFVFPLSQQEQEEQQQQEEPPPKSIRPMSQEEEQQKQRFT